MATILARISGNSAGKSRSNLFQLPLLWLEKKEHMLAEIMEEEKEPLLSQRSCCGC
jgi:hypothetical protein